MNDVISRVFRFGSQVFADEAELYATLAREGQSPQALMISCSDSRIVPEHIMQARPGELFVCRNAGNIVPPYSQANGGVTATVEYAVMVLGVSDIIVCGHSGCGAMKALMNPESLAGMPNVAAWLRHGSAAHAVVAQSYDGLEEDNAVFAASLENVVVQLAHVRTHPAVAAKIARGELTLHGWFVDIRDGSVLALDGVSGRFSRVIEDQPLPVAQPAARRRAADFAQLQSAA